MSTAGDVVDRLFREYLTPPSDQPIRATLIGALTITGSQLVFNASDLSVHETGLLGRGAILEVDQELMRSLGEPSPAGTVNVVRAVLGTAAAAHSTNANMIVAPKFPRKMVFDAVADSVVNLYPRLWHTPTASMSTGTGGFVEIPTSSATALIRVLYYDGSKWTQGGAQLLYDFPEVNSNMAVQFAPWMPHNAAVYVTYKSKFVRPTDEDSAMNGIEQDWDQLVLAGALAQLTTGLDIDAATQDFITEGMEAQGFAVGSGERISRAAIRFYEYMLDGAKAELAVRYPIPVMSGGYTYGGF